MKEILPPLRLFKIGLSIIGVAFAVTLYSQAWPPGFDAYCYWSVDPVHPYTHAWTAPGAFSYSPPLVLLFSLAKVIPFDLFLAIWMGLSVAVLMWLGRSWGLALLLFPPVLAEVFAGNIHLLCAAAIVVGFEYPAAWSLLLVSKVTPGIGLLWFAVRHEWRSLGIALGATAAICAASFVLAPDLWPQWFGFLATTQGTQPPWPSAVPIPLVPRLVAAVVVVVWGARTNRRWTVPIAAMLALPALWLSGIAMLAAVPRLSSRTHNCSSSRRLPERMAAATSSQGAP